MRRNLSGPELIDGITFLYNKYSNAKAVHEATGLPYNDVRKYVKYPRLSAGLKKLVEKGEVDLKVALGAQNLAERRGGKSGERELAGLAKGVDAMSRAQRAQFAKAVVGNPNASVEELLASAQAPVEEVSQIIVTLPRTAHEALKARAKEQGVTQDQAAAAILVGQLTESG
ncbi:MAG: hypothetical protein OXE83_13195 [Gammaproteobacteria bacterium]|nr:hypothetical protein [Gammaproteobacteria bacterium]